MLKYTITLIAGAALYFGATKYFNLNNPSHRDSSLVIHAPAKEIMESATATKTFRVEYKYSTSWGGSDKTIQVKGDFRAKAGYNHNSFDMENGLLLLQDPVLLSCELVYYEVEENDGWWNKIQDDERMKAVNRLCSIAKKQALDDNLIETAKTGAKKVMFHYTKPDKIP